MENFEFYKKIRLDDNKKFVFSKLKEFYELLPDTEGCLDNINKKGGCNAWCCRIQSPQLLYIEFLYAWNEVLHNWDISQICELIERAMKNYILGRTTKKCIFFQEKDKKCPIHDFRPLSCRSYGIMPEEEFRPKYEKLKAEFKDVVGAIVKEQCNLIKCINSKIKATNKQIKKTGIKVITIAPQKITKEVVDNWWNDLYKLEQQLGISKENIHDNIGGSYRTYHDHLLLYMMPDDILISLQTIRLSEDINSKMLAVNYYMKRVKEKLNG